MRIAKIIYAVVAALLLCAAAGAAPAAAQTKANGKIAFERSIDGSTDIFVMNADGSGETNITDTPFNESQAAWSPDGSKLVFVRAPQVAGETVDLYVMDADGHNLKRLTSDDAFERFPAWSPDGKLIAYARTEAQGGFEQIYTITPDGFELKHLTAGLRGDHTYPAWAPDSKRIAFSSSSATMHAYEIWAMDADGARPTQLTTTSEEFAWCLSPSWSPDGKFIAFRRSSEILVLDLQAGAVTNLTNNWFDEDAPEWSPDGKRIVFARMAEGNLDIYSMKADGSDQRRLTADERVDTQPAWQPSSTQVAFVSQRDGNREIYLMGEDGGGVTRLTTNAAADTAPALSPDGRRVAFVSTRDGGAMVYVMNADGTGVVRLTNPPEVFAPQDDAPAWSPDGDKLVFSSRSRDSKFQLYVVNADGTGLKKISDGAADDMHPTWSPDGTKIAFTSLRQGDRSYDIYTVKPDGTGLLNLTHDDVDETDPAWSPDGARIAYARSCCSSAEIYVTDADGTNPVRLTDNTANDRDPAWSPDSTRVVFASLRNAVGNVSTYDLYAAAVDGSVTTRLTTDGLENVQPSWSASARPKSAAAHFIQITVLQPGEKPLAGVKLTLSGGASGSQTTDEGGFATFGNLPEGGTYTITASKDGYTFRPESRTFADLTDDTSGSFEAFRAAASISGRVLSGGSNGLAGVSVHLSGARRASTTTDGQGAYSFADLPAGGDYTVRPLSDVYNFTPDHLNVNALGGDATADFDAQLRTLKVGGRVADADGNPLAGVSVSMTGSLAETALTDADGAYSFNVPYGADVTLKAAHDRYTFNPVSAHNPRVTADGTTNFKGTLVVFRVGGRVTNAAQTGIAGVTVRLGGAREATATTDAGGRYEFAGLPKGGSYTVTPEHATLAFTPAVRQLDNLGGNQTADFKLAQSQVTISGRVRDAAGRALAGASVLIANKGGQPSPFYTDAEGFYSAKVLAGASYTVTASRRHYTFAPASRELEQVGGDRTADFTATLQTHGVSGRVLDANGKPLAGVTLALDGSAQATLKTDAEGFYNFTGLPAGGGYTLTPALEGYTFDPASQGVSELSESLVVNFHAAAVVEPARVQFSAASFSAGEGARLVSVRVTRGGDTAAEGTVFYETQDGTADERRDYTTALGTLRFAPGETEKSFDVLLTDDAYAEGPETLTLKLSDATGGLNLGATTTAALVVEDDDAAGGANPSAEAEFFVRQHYHDFLNREPDAEGLKFWADQLTACGGDAGCLDHVRQNVSAAFFLSIEFQQTGYLVHRLQRVSYGRLPRYRDLVRDTQEIGRGVVVGQGQWREQLESNKRAFLAEWASRPEFAAKYAGMPNAEFVDALWANVSLTPAPSERDELVAGLESGALARADVLRRVAESASVTAAESNRAFVLMEYFGYLRRNPDDRPDADMSGYRFWLDKFDSFGGDYRRAEMVRSFIVSLEYQRRFGQ